MLKSVAAFCGAFLLGCVHWHLLNFLSDWSPWGNAGILWAAALTAAVVWIGTLLFRTVGSVAARTAAAAILFLAASLVDLGTPDTPKMWWLVAVAAVLPVGLVTAYFLRGIRTCAGPAAIGYLLPAVGVWALVEYSMWYWLPLHVLFYGGVAVLLAAAWQYKLSSMAWLSLTSVALIAGLSYPNYLAMKSEHDRKRTAEDTAIVATIDGGRRLKPADERSGDVYRLGGQWLGSYPADFASRPSALIALLQFRNHNLSVLTVVPPFSPLPLEIARYPWVARIDWLSSDPGLARFLTNTAPGYYDAAISFMATRFQLGGPYDLIFVTDGNPEEWADFLTEGGVLAVTPNTDRPELARRFAHRMPVPGPGRVMLYSHRPLETDLEALDRQMGVAAMGEAPLQAGALSVLYSLPADYADAPAALPPGYSPRWPGSDWIRSPLHGDGSGWWWIGGMFALLAVARFARFWLERWTLWLRIGSDLDAGFSVGFGLVLVWCGLAQQGEPLFLQVAAIAVLALTAGTLPSGIRKIVGILIWIAPLAGVALLNFFPWGTVLAGIAGVLGIGYWRGGHSSHAPWASARVLWALAVALLLAALSLAVPGGLWLLALAAFIWRRMPF